MPAGTLSSEQRRHRYPFDPCRSSGNEQLSVILTPPTKQDCPMKDQLAELIRLISSGCMSDDEINRLADEAAQAYADPQGFLQANPDIIYDDDFPIPLGEWMIVGSLPDTVLFQADDFQTLFEQILGSFGPDVPFVLKPKQLAKTEPLKALNRIQTQLSSLYPEKGGYVLVDFSEPLDDELQTVLVYTSDMDRVMALAVEVGIYAAPALAALQADQGE
jgi:hypothetical protein